MHEAGRFSDKHTVAACLWPPGHYEPAASSTPPEVQAEFYQGVQIRRGLLPKMRWG